MDLWLIAATAATGCVTKHLQNVSKGKETCFPEDFSYESPRGLVSRLVRRDKKPNEEYFEDCINGEDVDVLGVEVVASGCEEISPGNRAFLRRKQRYRKLIKPTSRLHREESMLSPFPSPCGSVLRPLVVVTDGSTKVVSKNNGYSLSQRAQPQLRKLESSGLYVKRRDGNASRRFGGASDAALLLCVEISIGIMSSFVTNQTEVVNKVKAELNQTESLVKDSEDELKRKDSLTENDGEKTAEDSEESISEIEAELVAELERLQTNMNSSNIETQPADAFELEPDFEVEFAQGELRDDDDDDDKVGRQRFDETESNHQEPCGNATPESGNYTVSPHELSLRLHKVINSRCEERIKELEMALQESQRKVEQLVMEKKKKPYSRLCESHAVKRDSMVDAFNECYEELMDIKDYSEEGDLAYEMEEELDLTSKSSPWRSHKDYYVKASSRTSEDVNFFSLQDLLGLSDEEEEEEEDREFESDEMEKQLIKQIVEKTKQVSSSSSVFNAQKMLSLMKDIEHYPSKR